MQARLLSGFLFQLFFSLFQRVRKLVGTGGFLHAAMNAVKAFDHGINIHALNKLGNTLQVAVAAANKLDVFYGLAVHVK